ncbi:MAG: flagellar basal body-associated FliL family protein [Oligoflexia bacterium]|nr:flagellar basal body-associated FliL family protein [Oligoflexia bacterium]
MADEEKKVNDQDEGFEEFSFEEPDISLDDITADFDLDNLDTDEGLDDSFLANFEDAMLKETETGAQVQKVEIKHDETQAKLDTTVSDDHTTQVIDMIDRSGLDVDVKKVETVDSIKNLELDFEKIDLSAIDLAKLNVDSLETDSVKIGFDLSKINLQDFEVNIEEVDIDNIDFDKIHIDLGGIVSFEEAEKEIKKSNVLLPAPVRGFYGRLFLNPIQEFRNAFGKSYNEILQIARPAEAYRRQIEEGIIIEADDIIKMHKGKKAPKPEGNEDSDATETEADKIAEQELKESLGQDWDKIEEKPKDAEEKEKRKFDISKIIAGFFRSVRSFYLRVFLISWLSKFLLLTHFVLGAVAVYYFSTNAMDIIKKIYSTRDSQEEIVDSLEIQAIKTKDPHKRIPGAYASIPKLMGSFTDPGTKTGTRMFQMGIFVELESYETQEEFTQKAVLIKDRLITYLNNVKYTEIRSTLGKERLKGELQAIINQNLKKGKAISIYYSDFVIN